jgi:hypothetical protein
MINVAAQFRGPGPEGVVRLADGSIGDQWFHEVIDLLAVWCQYILIICVAYISYISSKNQHGSLDQDTVNSLRPIVEAHIRGVVQQAHKYQRRSKSLSLKGR